MKQINISKHRALIDQVRKLVNASHLTQDRDQRLKEVRDQIEATSDALDKALIAGGLHGAHCHGISSLLSSVVPDAISAIDLPRIDLIGATVTWISGKSVPSAYKWQRKATKAIYVVKPTGLFLVSVEAVEIGKGGGSIKVTLHDAAIEKLCQKIKAEFKK